jgi:putative addiction module killer protein
METVEIRQTEDFHRWLEGLADRQARARVLLRIRRLSLGNLGDVASVGEGVLELRIHCGPGYRVYFRRQHRAMVVLLTGGDKRNQDADIRRAKDLARGLEGDQTWEE